MIIGNGSLAKLLDNVPNAVLFASGVGNSQCNDKAEFERESKLLQKIRLGKFERIVYFSSLLCERPTNPYYYHKLSMEALISRVFRGQYMIIRIGNIWECTNPNTFINYLRSHHDAEIKDEYRYMVHASDINQAITEWIGIKDRISLYGEALKVKECLSRL